MKRFIVGSIWDRTNRNGINNNFLYLFEGVATMNNLNIKADATLLKADAVLMNAQSINQSNVDVQKQLDNIILESGTSDAEVVQSRLAYNGEEFTTLKERLDARDKNLLSRDVNAIDFGIVGDGIADDTEALQAASDHAASLGLDKVLFIPKGNYRTTDTVTFKNSLNAVQATIRYEGSGTAIILGDDSAGSVTARQFYNAPKVINRSRGSEYWDDTSVGIKCVNLNTCEITIPFIQDFETGLLLYGYGQGCSYNTIFIGALWDNRKNLLMDSDTSGWCNQTLFINGRLQQSLSKGAFENDPDAVQIKLGSNGSRTSNNTFINTSIEGYNVGEYRLDIAGSSNHFYNMRFENHSSENAKVMYRENSVSNKISGGFHSHNLDEVFETTATQGGVVEDGITPYIKATLKSGITVPSGVEYHDVKALNVESHRVRFEESSGEFYLKPGRWYIEAKATFGKASGGAVYIRLLRGSSVRASQVARPDSTYQFGITCNTIDVFDETTPLKIQVRQSTTEENLTLNSGQYTTLIAHYLGNS